MHATDAKVVVSCVQQPWEPLPPSEGFLAETHIASPAPTMAACLAQPSVLCQSLSYCSSSEEDIRWGGGRVLLLS